MGKYYETWQNALNQVHNWKPGINTHQQMLKEAKEMGGKWIVKFQNKKAGMEPTQAIFDKESDAITFEKEKKSLGFVVEVAPPAGVSGGGVKKDDHFEKVKKVKDQINKQKDKVAKFDLGDPKQKTPHALATADLKSMNLKLRDMQTAENEPETNDVGKPNKKKEIKEKYGKGEFALYVIRPYVDRKAPGGQRKKGDRVGPSMDYTQAVSKAKQINVGSSVGGEKRVEVKPLKESKEEPLNEGMKLANLVGQSIAHLDMYVELANDIKKEYFKTNSQVSMFIKAKADQVSKSVPKLVKELRRPGIWSESFVKTINAVKFWESKQIEDHDCEKEHPNKSHKEWLNIEENASDGLQPADVKRLKDLGAKTSDKIYVYKDGKTILIPKRQHNMYLAKGWKQSKLKAEQLVGELEQIAEELRDMEDYRAKSKTLQSIQNDPKQMNDPQMRDAVMKRKFKLSKELSDLRAKQARQKPIAAEVEPGTVVKEELQEEVRVVAKNGNWRKTFKTRKQATDYLEKHPELDDAVINESPFAVSYSGTKTANEKQRGANIVRQKKGTIKVDAKDGDSAKKLVSKILDKRMSLRRYDIDKVRAEDFKTFRESQQPGFAVRYSLDGKRLVQAYKTEKDAEHRAKILKSMGGVKDVSITKHTLNFKEDSNVKYKVVDAKTKKAISDKSLSYNNALHLKKQKGPGYEIKPVDAYGNVAWYAKEEKTFGDLEHKNKPVEVKEGFTTSQITNLRKQWATVKTINPTGDKYKALVKWINDKEFDTVDELARAKINFVSYIAKKALMDKWKFKKDTINKMYGGLLSNQYENLTLDKVFKEVSPPGWEGSVRAMKKHPELGGEDGKDGKNIYALAWYLKNKGAKSHYKDKGGKPVKKDKYKNEETENHAQMISGVENEGRKETTNE